MSNVTFGYMDPGRDSNATLFEDWRSLFIKAFEGEGVCTLSSFYDDSIEECEEILPSRLGPKMALLRDAYYRSVEERHVPIRLPDIQSFFLYSFTLGVNSLPYLLSLPDEIEQPPADVNELIPSDEVLARQFTIRGPEWLCAAANREMPSVENVFCAFQNDVLLPMAKSPQLDHRLLADAIATSFLWSFFGGTYWLKEVVLEICECIEMTGGRTDESGTAVYQVKKSMQMIDNEHIERVLKASDIFREK